MTKNLLFTLFTGLSFILSGCTVTSKVWDPYDDISISALQEVNTDTRQRPSPVQIKIYELSSRSTFDNLDFDRAFYDAGTFLSDELLSEADYTLQPGQTIEHRVKLKKQAQFVAILAGFIDIDNARWKHVYPVKSRGYQSHAITLGANKIIEGKPKQSKVDRKQTDTQTDNGKALTLDDVEKGTETIEKATGTAESIKGLLNK